MKKNDVFTFTAPNGEEVIGVCLKTLNSTRYQITYLCYAQNRLFTIIAQEETNFDNGHVDWITIYGEDLVDYCILPDYDTMLEDYQHQIDMANDYADKTL